MSLNPQNSPSNGKINPAILFIIIILAVIFFISGLLHLLVRFLLKQKSNNNNNNNNNYQDNNLSNSFTYQRQLQQLFTLHDSGLDQAFIDALPVFLYKEIVQMSVSLAVKDINSHTQDQGSNLVKEQFDCAVCLCEFSECDKLRLLPLCSHAFHIDCIDTWLLSNSTCPLCRSALYTPDIDVENPCFEDDKLFRFPVRLGKFRSTCEVDKEDSLSSSNVGETSSSNLDARRCYSMGSYEYIVDDSILQVATLCPNILETTVSKPCNDGGDVEGRKINVGSKKESLSVSKIWLWSKKSKFPNASNGEFSGVDMSLPWRSNRS